MKNLLLIIAGVLYLNCLSAQTPTKFSYQAVIRNNSNALVVNSSVGIKVSILQGSASGTVVYSETHNPTSNANGLISIEVGGGTVGTGTFSNIDWSIGLYFIKTEFDINGGTNYSLIGTTELLSVPYALHAKSAEDCGFTIFSDSIYVGSNDWVNISGNFHSYTYTNNHLTQDVVSRGIVNVYSWYPNPGYWVSWPFYSGSNGGSYHVDHYLNTILLRVDNVSPPATSFKIVIIQPK